MKEIASFVFKDTTFWHGNTVSLKPSLDSPYFLLAKYLYDVWFVFQAIANNPDPERLLPVPILGFKQLHQR